MSIVPIKKFITSGGYHSLKIAEARVDAILSIMKAYQEDEGSQRIELKDAGVVCRFVNVNVYRTNHVALNEYLMDLGILPVIANVDLGELTEEQTKLLQPHLIPGKPYIKFTPKGTTRVDSSIVADEVNWLRDASFKDQASTWRTEKGKPNCDADIILRVLGEAALITCARVDSVDLDECCAKGFLRKPEIGQFRQVVDVSRRYIVMEAEKEVQIQDFFNRRLQRLSRLSQNQQMA